MKFAKFVALILLQLYLEYKSCCSLVFCLYICCLTKAAPPMIAIGGAVHMLNLQVLESLIT